MIINQKANNLFHLFLSIHFKNLSFTNNVLEFYNDHMNKYLVKNTQDTLKRVFKAFRRKSSLGAPVYITSSIEIKEILEHSNPEQRESLTQTLPL